MFVYGFFFVLSFFSSTRRCQKKKLFILNAFLNLYFNLDHTQTRLTYCCILFTVDFGDGDDDDVISVLIFLFVCVNFQRRAKNVFPFSVGFQIWMTRDVFTWLSKLQFTLFSRLSRLMCSVIYLSVIYFFLFVFKLFFCFDFFFCLFRYSLNQFHFDQYLSVFLLVDLVLVLLQGIFYQ